MINVGLATNSKSGDFNACVTQSKRKFMSVKSLNLLRYDDIV